MGRRQIRKGFLLMDLPLFFMTMPVDFQSGAIYKPCNAYYGKKVKPPERAKTEE